MTIKTIESNHAPAPVGPYSPALQVDNLLFISGQIPLTSTGDLVAGDFEAETRQVLTNIGALLNLNAMRGFFSWSRVSISA